MNEPYPQRPPSDSVRPEHLVSWWQTSWGIGLSLGGVLAIFSVMCFLSPISWLKGETDLFGNYRFVEEFKSEQESLRGMALVHGQLFPDWMIKEANRERVDTAVADEHFARLRAEVEGDEVLPGILDRLRELVRSDDLAAQSGEVRSLIAPSSRPAISRSTAWRRLWSAKRAMSPGRS